MPDETKPYDKTSLERGGKTVYKCRRCGQEEKSTHIPSAFIWLLEVVSNTGQEGLWMTRKFIGGHAMIPDHTQLTGVHNCADHGIGVTDLIGMEMDD